jgi:hypothetical protein
MMARRVVRQDQKEMLAAGKKDTVPIISNRSHSIDRERNRQRLVGLWGR